MKVLSDIDEIRGLCQKWRKNGETISFVPTMGCLHEGHLSLVNKARSLADHVVVSIFVNPLQFGEVDDFLNYPSTLEDDICILESLCVDVVFNPESKYFYPEGENAVQKIELGEITSILEGAHRPGHFAGVATVVKRLFDIIEPNTAIFGEKDFQQLMVIKQLVRVFSLDIEIIGMTTLRESDGLAMSSRNLRLSTTEREIAPEIFRQLELIKRALEAGESNFTHLEERACKNLESVGFIPEYFSITESETLLPVKKLAGSMVILAAAKLGEIRLIDNLKI